MRARRKLILWPIVQQPAAQLYAFAEAWPEHAIVHQLGARPPWTHNCVLLDHGEELDFILGGDEAQAKLNEIYGKKPKYADVSGLCRVATLEELEIQGSSLNPGCYVGVGPGEAVSNEDFKDRLETLNEELEPFNAQGRDLEQTIARNVAEILEA